MGAAAWGALCALSFGAADFVARYSSRAVGHASALLGMLVVGTIGLTLWVAIERPTIAWSPGHVLLVALNGVTSTAFLLLLYRGLARGPIAVVAPIVATHPVLIVLFWVALGARPSVITWIAMAGTLVGSVLVAWAVEPGGQDRAARRDLWITIAIASAATLFYAVAVGSGQAVVPGFGALPTLWVGRGIGLAALVLLFLWWRERPRLPRRWLPVLTVQGVLDTAGYLFLLLGSAGAFPEIAAVAGSTFGAVTTLLAWLVLRERINALQGLGIVLVFVCVGVLTAQG
ncbi:MAG: DMT family transporter [Alphaproteobacteria bacterium]|nr:DMT family transporter [Alphaproteobacteria bacterium]